MERQPGQRQDFLPRFGALGTLASVGGALRLILRARTVPDIYKSGADTLQAVSLTEAEMDHHSRRCIHSMGLK
jgi:hypothetical protein